MTGVIVGTVTNLVRLPKSTNGNPRFQVTIRRSLDGSIPEVTHPTGVDSALALGIENSEYRVNLHRFELDQRGCLIAATRLSEETAAGRRYGARGDQPQVDPPAVRRRPVLSGLYRPETHTRTRRVV